MSSDYLTREEFNRHKDELIETIEDFNKAFTELAKLMNTLTERVKDHEECIRMQNETLREFFE